MLAAQELGDADHAQARRHEQGEGCTGAQARGHPASHARHRNTIQRRCRGGLLIGRRNTVFGRPLHTRPYPKRGPCRDDGSGQADIPVVDAISRCDHAHRRLAGLSSTNPIRRRPLCRSRTEASPGKWITQKNELIEARYRRSLVCSVKNTQDSHHRYVASSDIPRAMVLRLPSSSPRRPAIDFTHFGASEWCRV